MTPEREGAQNSTPAPESVPANDRRGDALAVAVLAVATFAFLWRFLFTGEYSMLAGFDGSVQFYAWYRFAAHWVRQGVLPLWDPYVYGGHSFIGEAQAGLFYPFNLLQAFLIPNHRELLPSDVQWMIALHMFLSGLFTYVLARVLGMARGPALVSAAVFAFGGFMARRVVAHINIYYGCVWLPLILALLHLAATRRRPLLAIAAGLALGVVALAGHLMPPVFSGITLALYALYLSLSAWRKRQGARAAVYPLLLCIVAGVFALGVAAVQMLPSLEYEALSYKWTGVADALPLAGGERSPYWIAGGYYYMRPQSLVSFLIAYLNAPPEGTPYVGILALVLAAIGALAWRRNASRFFVALGIGALIFAMGSETVLHGLAWRFVPILDKARAPVRALYLVCLCLALLAGWGCQAMTTPTPRLRRVIGAMQRALVVACTLVIAGGIIVAYVTVRQSPAPSLDSYFTFLVMAALACIVIWLWRPLRVAPRFWLVLVLAVILFDNLSLGAKIFLPIRGFNRQNNFAPERLYQENGAIRFLQSQPGLFRVDVRNDALPANFGDVWQVFSVTGHGNTMAADYLGVRNLAWYPPSRLYDMLNIRYIVATDTIATLPLVYDGNLAAGDLKVYENPTARPRAWLVQRATVLPPGPATWERLKTPGFDPAAEAVVASPVEIGAAASSGAATITQYTLHAIAIAVHTETDGLLVTSENYYPGWTVSVDGQAAALVRVNGGLRGVRVPAGQHDVIFSYDPVSFRIGAIMTLLTLASAALLFGASVARRPLQAEVRA